MFSAPPPEPLVLTLGMVGKFVFFGFVRSVTLVVVVWFSFWVCSGFFVYVCREVGVVCSRCFWRDVTDVCRSCGGKCPGLGLSCFGLRVRTLPIYVGVVVVSAL